MRKRRRKGERRFRPIWGSIIRYEQEIRRRSGSGAYGSGVGGAGGSSSSSGAGGSGACGSGGFGFEEKITKIEIPEGKYCR